MTASCRRLFLLTCQGAQNLIIRFLPGVTHSALTFEIKQRVAVRSKLGSAHKLLQVKLFNHKKVGAEETAHESLCLAD